MADSRPESTDGHLTNRQIVLLGSAISSDNMKAIALGYMDFTEEAIRNIEIARRDDQQAFNRDIITQWKNKNSGPDQVKKLASLLFEAADEGSFADPAKIQRILKVSREQSQSGPSGTPISEKELKDLADILRPITEEQTNIDMIPWLQNYTVKLEDLYTELSIDKLENQPTGLQKTTSVRDYKELFTGGSGGKVKGRRILGKGDPGSGKTTFAKKIAWDWAKENLKEFSLVFFVSFKFVLPGDSIENMIIQQNPELEGLRVKEQKLRDILETFGRCCLIILDGYDEHVSGGNKPNEDIIKLIKGQKFLSCNVLLTSRPHIIAEIEQNFSTVVSIQGFTEKHAREFAFRVLVDKDKIDPIMEIQCVNAGEYIREGNSVFTCPILLLFLCVLVNGDEIDLTRKEVMLGEIYTRLVRCLYRKYTVRKGIAFKQSEFVEVLMKVGLFAKETLFNVKMIFQRSEVISVLGEDAFDYGLLIGHEDFRLSAQETADIIISFPHRTIQEFLGALCSILLLDIGQSVATRFFTSIPLVLHFCLWFLGKDCSEEYFHFENKDEIYRQIETFAMNEINFTEFGAGKIVHQYPALNIGAAQRDELVLQFVQTVLFKCEKLKHLVILKGDPVGQIMSTFRTLLPQLLSIQLPVMSDYVQRLCSEEIHIVIYSEYLSCVDELLHFCKGLDKPLAVHFIMREPTDLCKNLTANISSLHIWAEVSMDNCLSRLHTIPYSPHLRNLHLQNQRIDEDFALALSNIVEKGNLPNIKLLRLRHCDLRGKLSLLFQSKWPTLTHLDLYDSFLAERDTGILGNVKVLIPNLTSLVLCLGSEFDGFAMTEMLRLHHSDNHIVRFPRHIAFFDLFESPLPNMTELWMNSMNKEEYKKLISAIDRGRLPQLRELGIEMSDDLHKNQMVDMVEGQINRDDMQCDVIVQGNTLDWLPSVNAPTLIHLTLHRFICSIFHLAMVMQSTVLTRLHKLDISHSSGITGTLSILFLCNKFLSLNTLSLSDCGLNSQDLCSLAQTRAKGRLPELRHLDISRNDSIQGKLKDLFSFDAQWENLCSLNASNHSTHPGFRDNQFYNDNDPPSNELAISESVNFLFQPGNRCWKHVQKMYLFCDKNDGNIICSEISDALERGLLPALNIVLTKEPRAQSLCSGLRPLLVNLLPNNVINKVIEHTETVIRHELSNHFLAQVTDFKKKVIRGENPDEDLMCKEVVETTDLSSFLSLIEDEGLTEAQTKELMDTIRKCLTISLSDSSEEANDRKFRKYGVVYCST